MQPCGGDLPATAWSNGVDIPLLRSCEFRGADRAAARVWRFRCGERVARIYLCAGRECARKCEPGARVTINGTAEHSTGCGAGDRTGAEKAVAEYVAEKHAPEWRGQLKNALATRDRTIVNDFEAL